MRVGLCVWIPLSAWQRLEWQEAAHLPPPPPLPAEPIPQDARPLLNADPPRGWPHVAACCEPCEPPVGRAWSLGQGDDS